MMFLYCLCLVATDSILRGEMVVSTQRHPEQIGDISENRVKLELIKNVWHKSNNSIHNKLLLKFKGQNVTLINADYTTVNVVCVCVCVCINVFKSNK